MTLTRLSLALLLAGGLAACDSSDEDGTVTATATLSPPAGVMSGGVSGTVNFSQDDEVLTMRLALTGATPGEHGFHVHEVGSCAPADLPDDPDTDPDPAGAAKGHYDPLNAMDHGAPTDSPANKHAGDLGNVTASSSGEINTTVTTTDLSIESSRSIVGRSVMVHSGRDDLTSDPGGKSGTRVGCGVITSTTK